MKTLTYLRSLGILAFLVTLAMVGLSSNAQALSCPSGKVSDGGLCYDPPRNNYSCSGISCSENCPAGYSSSGFATCHYTAGGLTYTEAPHKKHASTPHKCGLMYYANCRTDYHMDACGICTFKGKWDVTRGTYFRAAGFSPDVSAAFNAIGSTVNSAWQTSVSDAELGYNIAKAELQKLAADLELLIFRELGNAAISQNKAFLTQMNTNFQQLLKDPDAVNIMKRIIVAAAAKRFDDSARADMLYIGQRMGVVQQQSSVHSMVSSNVSHASWGIMAGLNAGYQVVGAAESIGMIANTWKDPGQPYGIGGVWSFGGIAGFVEGAAATLSFFWQPGGMDSAGGGYIGLGFAAAPEGVGGTVGLTWSLAQGMSGAKEAIPGFYIGGAMGSEIEAALLGGFTVLLK
jgi:hypothetical protein